MLQIGETMPGNLPPSTRKTLPFMYAPARLARNMIAPPISCFPKEKILVISMDTTHSRSKATDLLGPNSFEGNGVRHGERVKLEVR